MKFNDATSGGAESSELLRLELLGCGSSAPLHEINHGLIRAGKTGQVPRVATRLSASDRAMKRPLRKIDARGATAVETAMLLPLYLGLTLCVFGAGFLIYTAASLHFAVEAAARCGSVMATQCTGTASTQTYASSHYYGPNTPAPTFTATSASCGSEVSGSVTFAFNAGVTTWNVPLSATACFP